MRFSTREDYGMILMANLARRSSNAPVSLRQLAQEEQLSFLYLEQLAAKLKQKGLLVSQRGAQGGYRLARDPKEVTVGDVVRALDAPGLVRCIHGECEREPSCTMKPAWQKLQDQIDTAMDKVTLSEFSHQKSTTPAV